MAWVSMSAKYLIDSSAWIAYLQGDEKGAQIHSLVDDGAIAISIIALAELADKFERDSHSFAKTLHFIQSRAAIMPLTVDIVLNAAKIKKRQRKTRKKFGLADALQLATAQAHHLTLITTDGDFCGCDGVKVL
jgi:predicted nucleic acid-binding protein